MANLILESATELLQAYNKALDTVVPKDLCDIVKFHGCGAAVSSAAAGLIPGAGGVAATVCYAGFIWTLYGRLGKKIGLPFNKHILKSLAAGVATNLAAYAVASLVVSSVISLFPGIGSLAASAIDAGMGYAIVSASGIVYMKVLTKMFKNQQDPTTFSAENLSDIAKETMSKMDMKGILKNLKSEYKEAKDEKIEIDESDSEEYSEGFSEEEIPESEENL